MLEVDYAQQKDDQSKTKEIPQGEVQQSLMITTGVIEREQTTSYQSVPFEESRYAEGAINQRTQFGETETGFENDVEYHTGGKMQNKLDPAIRSQDFKKLRSSRLSDSIKVEKGQNNPYCEMPKGQPSLDDGEQKSERIPREKPENLEPENKLKSTFLKDDLQKQAFKQSTVVSCDTSTQGSTQLSTTQTTFKQPQEELGKTPAFQEEEDIYFEEVKWSVVEEKKIDENIVSVSKKTDPDTRSKNHPPVKDACQTEDKASLKSTKKHPNKVQDGDKSSSHQNTSSRAGNGEINRSINVRGFFYEAPEVASKRKGTMESFAGNKKKQILNTDIQTRSTTTETGKKPEANGKKHRRKRAVTKCKKRNGETSKSYSSKNGKRNNEAYRLKSDSAIRECSRDSEVLSSTDNIICVRSPSSTGEKSCTVSGQFNVEEKEKISPWLLYVAGKEYEKMCDTKEPGNKHSNTVLESDLKKSPCAIKMSTVSSDISDQQSTTPALAKSRHDQRSTTTDMSTFVDVESHGTNSASMITSLIPNFQSLGVDTGEKSQEKETKGNKKVNPKTQAAIEEYLKKKKPFKRVVKKK